MILGAPLGLLALAALPAIVALHLFRTRYRERPTSALFLYGAVTPVAASGRTRRPLQQRLSLWLELLAALALAWWLADPRFGDDVPPIHLIAVVDSRWRMQATVDGGSSATRAREALGSRLAALASDDLVTVIASGAPPRLLAGPAATPRRALAALDGAGLPADSAWHDPAAAIDLARQLADGPQAKLLWISDRPAPGMAPAVAQLALGRRATTSGFSQVRWIRDQDGERLLLAAFGSGSRACIVADEGGRVLHREELRLGAVPVVLRLAEPPPRLRIALEGPDPLALDDAVELDRPAARTVRVRLALADPAAKPWRRAFANLPAIQLVEDGEHLTIASETATSAWSLRVTPGSAPPVLGPFLARRGHPLLADIDAGGLLWAGGSDETMPAAQVLLAAGSTVLLSVVDSGVRQAVTLHGDPLRGGLAAHPLFPTLVANLVEWRRSRLPGPSASSVITGSTTSCTLPLGAVGGVLRAPDGVISPLSPAPDGSVILPALDRSGRWTVEAAGGSWSIAALPLDPRQGDLDGAATVDIAATAEAPAGAALANASAGRGRAGHVLPLVVLLAAALAAWAAHRREDRQ